MSPSWAGWVGVVVGVLTLASIAFFPQFLFLLWILIVSIVMFFVWMIAVGILYYTLGAMDVWSKVNSTFSTLTSTPEVAAGTTDLITAGRVFGITAVVGAINIVLFTALATVAAFIYNAAAAMSGGVELTLGERD